jgi:Fe2+ transport system protein FeoA
VWHTSQPKRLLHVIIIWKFRHSGTTVTLQNFKATIWASQRDASMSFPLSDLSIGETGTVHEIHLDGKLRSYVTRFGFVEGAVVSVIRQVPLGSLRVYRIGQAEIALRPETAEKILVTRTQT